MTKERLAVLMRHVFLTEVAPIVEEQHELGDARSIWAGAIKCRDRIAGYLRHGTGSPAYRLSAMHNLSGFITCLFAFRQAIDKEEAQENEPWAVHPAAGIFENEIMALREAGQKEYAHDDNNAFANFERAAADLGIDRKSILWVFAMKHRDGVQSFLDGHRSQRENVRGRINDLIVYSLILRGMLEEETPVTP